MPINPKFNSVVLLENFNNYFNRKIKLLSNINDYIDNYGYDAFIETNFNPNDDVSAEIVFNFDKINIDPDYLVVCENCESVEDVEPEIVSRWFVLESTRTRNGQYHLKLRRDVIADYFNELRTAPIFVQKAWVKESDPFIFNSEGMNFNQIKVGERLLKDQTQSPWIVAYITRGTSKQIDIPLNENISSYITIADISNATGISQATLTAMLNTDGSLSQTHNVYSNGKLRFSAKNDPNPNPQQQNGFNIVLACNDNFDFKKESKIQFGQSTDFVYSTSNLRWDIFNSKIDEALANLINNLNNRKSLILSDLSTLVNEEIIYPQQLVAFNEVVSQRLLYYNGQYHYIDIVPVGNKMNSQATTNWGTYGNIRDAFTSSLVSDVSLGTGNIKYNFTRQAYAIQLTAISYNVASITLSSSRNPLLNREYDMVCMPYNDMPLYATAQNRTENFTISESDWDRSDQLFRYYSKRFTYLNDVGSVICEGAYRIDIDGGEVIINFRRGIDNPITTPISYTATIELLETLSARSQGDVCRRLGAQLGLALGQNCYDVQLLPYCPLTQSVYKNGVILDNLVQSKDFDYVYDSNSDVVGVVFYCTYDSFQVNINERIETEEESLKIENECHSYRLVSPNYQGIFDFSVAKNGGSVPSFTAFCTYKPYTPYIKVAPFFMNLYGAEYGDNRGLICGGDFSISRVDDAWVQYQLNNKNYQNIFNRDIQNLDFQQSIEMRLQVLGASVGAITGAGQGASTGFLASGSPYGAIAGAVLGGSASAVGGIIDTNILAQQQREARNYAIDKYNYQLGNIKALPHTLTKVSAWDINSKIFPFVEFYSCTDEEKEALKLKLQYESMTTMRIGTINEFITSEEHYFKGELIRCEDIASETHLIMAIYEELLKGVYIYE